MSSKAAQKAYRQRKRQERALEPDTSISVCEAGTRGGRALSGKAAGAGNGNAKLRVDQVAAIRALKGYATAVWLGHAYGVHPEQIRRIWRGENWQEE